MWLRALGATVDLDPEEGAFLAFVIALDADGAFALGLDADGAFALGLDADGAFAFATAAFFGAAFFAASAGDFLAFVAMGGVAAVAFAMVRQVDPIVLCTRVRGNGKTLRQSFVWEDTAEFVCEYLFLARTVC